MLNHRLLVLGENWENETEGNMEKIALVVGNLMEKHVN